MKKTLLIYTATVCLATLTNAAIIIDYNDGTAGGGHDLEVLNGGLSSETQPTEWTGDYVDRDDTYSPVSGGNNIVISADRLSTIDTGYEITAGESYAVSYGWRDAGGWGDNESVNVNLFYTDDDTVSGTQTILFAHNSGSRLSNRNWEYESGTSTNSDALSVGKNLFVSITVTSSSNTRYARFDDLYVKATAIPEPASTALLGLGGIALLLRRRK